MKVKRCWAWLGALVFAAAVTLAGGPAAVAAEYEVWSCRDPDGLPISTVAWQPSEEQSLPGEITFSDTCASGGSLDVAVSGLTVPVGRTPLGQFSLDLPAGLAVKEYELWRYLKVAPISAYRAGITEESLLGPESRGCSSILVPPLFTCFEAGAATDPYGPGNHLIRSGLDLTGLKLWAECSEIGCLVTLDPPAAHFRLFASRVVIEDLVPPAPPLLSGSLLEPGLIRGKANLMVETEDVGSGIESFAISIDGGPEVRLPARDTAGTCEEPYDRAQPCPALAARLFSVDTDLLSEGPHNLTGSVRDAAGNVRSFGPISFEVGRWEMPGPGGGGPSGGGPGGGGTPANGNPAVDFPIIRLGTRRLNHRPGVLPVVQGRLLTPQGQPVAGAVLDAELEVNRLRQPRRRALPAVRTRADGSFRLPVPGEGHRTVTLSFSPVSGQPPTRVARVQVVSRLSMQLTRRPARLRRGQRFTITGRLRGGGETVEGANVEIQSIVGGRWRTVANVPARRGGRFRWDYRFRYVDRDAIFSFRAVVRRTPGWPWPTLRSRSVAVRIDVPSQP